MTEAEWWMAEAKRLMAEVDKAWGDVRAMQADMRRQLDEAGAIGKQYDDMMARGRGVLDASTNEEYYLRLTTLLHQHNEYYAMLVARAVSESMHKAFTIAVNPN